MRPHALLIAWNESARALEQLVRDHGFEAVTVTSLEEAREKLEENVPELAVVDLDLVPDEEGGLLDELLSGFVCEVVLITGKGSVDSAVDAIRAGALDYIARPIDTERLGEALERVRRMLSLHKEVSNLRENLRRLGRFGPLVGSSPAMQTVYDLVARVARTPSTVLITGETGTGKDVIATTIHRMSRRAEKPFVAVNCGAIQPSLIESELFGHEAGSFTGATKTRKGLFEQADKGTLFLDEVTEMPAELQVKLLRVLETRTFRRVGGEKRRKADVRLIAATNRSPEEALEEGKLREDLYYRLKVFPIHVPPLRERGKDVELLASYFLEQLNEESGQSQELETTALDELRSRDWPGNVRELRNAVERASILAGDQVTAHHFRTEMQPEVPPSTGGLVSVPVGSSIAEAEKRLILATLAEVDGDKKEASQVLGISLKTLYNRLKSYETERSQAIR